MIVKKSIIIIIAILLLSLASEKNDILNDIIIVGENDYRYVNFVTTPYGEMFLETYGNKTDMGRIFYGINKNGSEYFKNSTNHNNFIFKKYSIITERVESELAYVYITDANKENYFDILISFANNYIELFTYKNPKRVFSYIKTDEFLSILNISETYIWSSNTFYEDNINYYLLAFISNYTMDSNILFLYNIYKINFI
jgi:hypothetical protein